MKKDEVSMEIIKHIGVISEYPSGWKREVNLIAWNGNPPKYDLRDWSEDHVNMSRGLTLTADELKKLGSIIGGVENW